MVRQRRGAPSDEESSDEEDAFAKMTQKNKKNKKTAAASATSQAAQDEGIKNDKKEAPVELPVSTTSSMKRHHVTHSDTRKAKMDALLLELEAEKSRKPIQDRRGFVPEKKGSFVDPSEEHLTTNIFVGNLSPSLTEEEVTDVFRQFGDLYSVKIMWPRSEEERRRNRNTGFVCFMKRDDAEEAMITLDEGDPFGAGRRLMLRWGKNVKKIIKRGTGGVAVAPIRKRSAVSSHEDSRNEVSKRSKIESSGSASGQLQSASNDSYTNSSDPFASIPVFDPQKHGNDAVRVDIPSPPARAHIISMVASFVAKDGVVLEKKLLELEAGNADFAFLSLPPRAGNGDTTEYKKQKHFAEHMFYRWRVYAFCQGDGLNVWRTEPFMMIRPNGIFWIPPALNREAARQEEQERKRREEDIERQKKQRRRRVLTGRQLEQARRGGLAGASDGGAQLTREEVDRFSLLVRKKLCASRESICEAMAFCFEKSGAAKQIAMLLKEVLLEDENTHPGISLETRIARLYVLSDVLFNSQQPGVRNAFLYRDSVERMAPEVFTSLGKHGSGTIGRMTRNKLSTAVSAVLGAWTNWSVYNPAFLDELHDRFEGREIKKETIEDDKLTDKEEDIPVEVDINANAVKVITEQQRGDWMAVNHEQEENDVTKYVKKEIKDDGSRRQRKESGHPAGATTKDDDSKDMSDDIDGDVLEEADLDGEALEDDDLDGEAFDDDDLDGEALEDGDVQ